MPERNNYVATAILVADLVGSSNFIGSQKDYLFKVYREQANNLLQQNNYQARLKSETAGDGLHIVFNDPVVAGNFALDLQDFMETFDWHSHGISPAPGIRIALHSGIVYRQYNAMTNNYDYTGHAHDLASRMEPVTAVNEIFASQAFVAQCLLQHSNIYFLYVGRRRLNKSAGDIKELDMYKVCRHNKRYWDRHSSYNLAQFGSEADWSWLKSMLYANRVIPVIGPELMQVNIEENGNVRKENLYDYAVKKLAGELTVPYSENMTFVDIFDKCCKADPETTEIRFKEIMEKLTEMCEPPEALCKLVELKCFPAFLVTTPDSFLKKIVQKQYGESWLEDWKMFYPKNEPEFKGKEVIDIKPNAVTPFIFHIFGKLNSHSDYYAVTENDMLMFSRAWNREEGPVNLKKYLEGREREDRKVILMLGCNYENWYARLFLFNLSAEPTCSTLTKNCGIIADNVSRNDSAFRYFLARDNYGKIFCSGNAEDFVTLLTQKMHEDQQPKVEKRQVSGSVAIYASPQDTAIGTALSGQVKKAGYQVKVIREHELQNMNRISMIMENAAVFIPIISTSVEALVDILKLGYAENIRRKGKRGEEYFMMPLFEGLDRLPDATMMIPQENCLRLNSTEVPLTSDALESIYRNLCINEDR